MNILSQRKIKTGSDPRKLPDYAALREELSKLTHPARPDIDWLYVEQRCLSLFEQNGVELQTAAWYTLARLQLAGLVGLNEGLALLEALVSHQWGGLWPQPIHARMDILTSLSQRVQQQMRTLSLNYDDLSQLYRAEQLLTRLGTVLQRLELKHLSQLDTLRALMHNSAARLESRDDTTSDILPGTTLDNGAISAHPHETKTPHSARWVYVAQQQHQPKIKVQTAAPARGNKWQFFSAGMFTMLLISVVAVSGWQYLHRPDPLQAQLAASLAAVPATLTPQQRDVLRQRTSLPPALLADTQQQLSRLEQLAPDWNIAYGQQLVEQAQALWPEQAGSLSARWQHQLEASMLPAQNLAAWHQGMMKLAQLSERLNGLDEQKGKYITVSELKSSVFGMMTRFQQAEPIEEQLRQIHSLPASAPQRQQLIRQLEQHLRSQIYTLWQMKNSIEVAEGEEQ
ncbi:VasL domain-containing protein [Pantoea dispersa]|uniref:VasL domain-containing protein n=1 Tax=Pantoea dispersa TaxID=59814 RepID=UPI0022234C2F|nr:VasL domain-containing protein [Pantoea dispersa]UYV58564.1 type VI secretion system ImpA family N-terminal domain-containing protein [Pantoea dispersa]